MGAVISVQPPQITHVQLRLITGGSADVNLIPRVRAVGDLRIQVVEIITQLSREMGVELIFQVRAKLIKILGFAIKVTTALKG